MVKLLLILYNIIGLLGLWVENPSSQRLVMLLLIGMTSGLSLFLPLIKRLHIESRWGGFLGALSAVSLLMLEQQSKYSVNEYFSLLYFIALIGVYEQKNSKRFLLVTPLLGLALSWKYVYIARISPDLLKIPQVVAALGVFALVALLLWLGLKLSREQAMMRQLNMTLEERTTILQLTNERLETAMTELEGLTVFRERQKMAREIHDTVGHELTALTMKLEMGKHYLKQGSEQGLALVEESISDSRRALRLTRQVVETLTNSRRSAEDLHQLIGRYDLAGGLRIALSGQEVMDQLTLAQSHVVYRAVQESITNCLKHADATVLNIALKVQADKLYLQIADDGCSKQETASIKENIGLKGMRERVEELGGSFAYDSQEGFAIAIVLPLEEVAHS